MIEIEATTEEVASGALTDEHLQYAVDAIEDDGYVVLHNTVALEHVDRIYERMTEDYREAVETGKSRHFTETYEDPHHAFGAARRGNQIPPYEIDYLFEDVLQNPIATQVMEAVMGSRVTAGTYSANVSLPGCGEQPLHVDQAPRTEKDPVGGPCTTIVMNIPLVPFTVENGATEIWPGTQSVPCEVGSRHPTAEQRAERIEQGFPPERAVMPRGAVFLRDIRPWHRGPGNYTSVYRPMLSQICSGGFDPQEDSIDNIEETGPFPSTARSMIEDGPLVYNATFA